MNENLIQIVEKSQNILRDNDGLTLAEAFDEIIKVLYTQTKLDQTFFTNIESFKQEFTNIESFKQEFTNNLYQKSFFNNDTITISNSSIRELLHLYNDVDFNKDDIKGRLFEIYLGRTFTSNLGQFFTPRKVVEFLSRYILSNIDSTDNLKILDPSCGSGGMLTYLSRGVTNSQFIGYDVDNRLQKVSNLNLTLNGVDKYEIRNKSFLVDDFNGEFDIAISNPPFGIKETKSSNLTKFELGIDKKQADLEVLFIEQILNSLKPNGICGIVLPDGVLNNSNKSIIKVRKLLLDKSNIIASIDLPNGVFKGSGTGVDTSLLIFKKKPTSVTKCKMFNTNFVGYETKTKFQRQIDENDLEDILSNKLKPVEIEQVELIKRMDSKYHVNTILVNDYQDKLNKYYDLITTSKKEVLSYIETLDTIKYIQYPDVDDKFGLIRGHTDYFSGEDLPSRANQIVNKGDIIVARLAASVNKIGIISDDYDGALVSSGFLVLRPKDKYSTEFIFSLFKINKISSQLKNLSTGSIMSGLSDTYFEEVRYNNISTDEIKERETVIKNVFFHIDKAYTLLNKKNKEVTT
jgi:type I restriction-modification system DNA methylase subunit